MSDKWIEHDGTSHCPVDSEQQVEVSWVKNDGTTKHRAGAFNWTQISEYRLLPNKPHTN